MTKKELKEKMLEFIDAQDSQDKDEWWGTDRTIKGGIIDEFAKSVGIDLGLDD